MTLALPSFRSTLVCALALCATLPAAAHTTPPEITHVVGESADEVVLASTRGLMFGDPSSPSGEWVLLCGEAFGVAAGAPYRALQLEGPRLVVADLSGLRYSDDRGCTFHSSSALEQLDVTDLTQDSEGLLYLTAFGRGEGGVQVSDDRGESFRPILQVPDDEFVGSLRIAPSDAARIYATSSTTSQTPRFFILRSEDRGASWARTELALDQNVLDISVLAVNPVVPDELLVRVFRFDQRQGDQLMRSVDGGRSFVELSRFIGIAGAAFSPDGSETFVATSDGLMAAPTGSASFARRGDAERLSHVSWSTQGLLVGGYRTNPDGTITSSAMRDGSSARPFMELTQVTSQLACDASRSRVPCDCELPWLDWRREYAPESPLPELAVCGPLP